MFGQFIINGLITGVLYSLLAIGFALVYKPHAYSQYYLRIC